MQIYINITNINWFITYYTNLLQIYTNLLQIFTNLSQIYTKPQQIYTVSLIYADLLDPLLI